MVRILAPILLSVLSLTRVDAVMLDARPVGTGGDPGGIWDADSLEIDVYATPTLRAAVSDLDLTGFVDGQISFESGSGYRFEYVVDVNISLTFLGGPIAVSLKDTVSEARQYSLRDTSLILERSGGQDTLAYSISADTLRLIQEVPLGDFATLAASIDPDGGAPLAVLKLYRVSGASRSADFDGDGTVGFPDFLAFASHFGQMSVDADFDATFDLDSDGSVGFTDFLVLVSQFGL